MSLQTEAPTGGDLPESRHWERQNQNSHWASDLAFPSTVLLRVFIQPRQYVVLSTHNGNKELAMQEGGAKQINTRGKHTNKCEML